MLCSKLRARTISFTLLLTYLVNFYQAYAIPPQKTYKALSSDDSSESSGCYYSDNKEYPEDSEGSSGDDTLLHPEEYPDFNASSSSQKSSNSSGSSSPSEECSGLTASTFFHKSLNLSNSSLSKKYSFSESPPCYKKSSSSSGSSSSEEYLCLNPIVFCHSQESSESSRSSSLSEGCPDSTDLSHSQEFSESSNTPRISIPFELGSLTSSQRSSNSSGSSSSSEGCLPLPPNPSNLTSKVSDFSHLPPELLHHYFNASSHYQESQKSPLASSDKKVNSPMTAQSLNPALEERNLVMDYIIENVSSHMADRATIACQRIKCYIKNILLNKSLYNQLTPELLITVMCYWDRIDYIKLIRDTKDEKNESERFFYTLITLFCIADKFTGDDLYNATVSEWAEIAFELKPKLKDEFDLHSFIVHKRAIIDWILKPKLIHYEKVLLKNLDYRLYVSREDYLHYKKILGF